MKYMNYMPSGINAITVGFSFENKITGEDVAFVYEVSFETFMEAARRYFDTHYGVVLNGRDRDIWNMLVDLGELVGADLVQDLIDDEDMQEDLRFVVEEEAHEKFDELCQKEAEEEVEELEDEDDVE